MSAPDIVILTLHTVEIDLRLKLFFLLTQGINLTVQIIKFLLVRKDPAEFLKVLPVFF